MVFILVLTCTSSFSGLVESGLLRFVWVTDPDFTEFLSPLPSQLSEAFLLQKAGHSLAFLVLTFLLFSHFRSRLLVLLLTSVFALITEFLQLYFGRGGRLFDIGFDLIGVLLAIGFHQFFAISEPRHHQYQDKYKKSPPHP